MERRIDLSNLDLDAAARSIGERTPAWEALGLVVGPLTWIDNEESWPRTLVHDRAFVVRPMSLGLQVRGQGGDEVEVVLYAGGWADTAVMVDGEAVDEYLELEAVDAFFVALDAMVARLACAAS